MKRVLLTLFLCSMLAPAAFADVVPPGLSGEQLKRLHEQRQRRFEEEMRAEAEAKIARVRVEDAFDGVQFVFEIAGPGTCEYTLRSVKSVDDPGSVVDKGSFTEKGADRHVVRKLAGIVPEIKEYERGRFRFEALCRVKLIEQTNFGPKETGEVKEVHIKDFFSLRRERFYRVGSFLL